MRQVVDIRDRAHAIRVESVVDFAPPAGQAWEDNPRTGLTECLAPLTWTGIRVYHFADGPARVLRRWEQVGSSGHMDTLKSLVVTQGHPMKRGASVNITRDNARGYQVGHGGDSIEVREIHGYTVPVARITITSPETTRLIKGTATTPGLTQTSCGYRALFDESGGMWDGPAGSQPFDIEHVLDPLDPRVLAHVEATKSDPVPFLAESLGANHFAAALARGMGGELSELVSPVVMDVAHPIFDPRAQQPAGRPCRVYMHRDAAGLTPVESETPVSDKAKIRVPFVVDGYTPKTARVFDVDPEVAAEIGAALGEMSMALAEMGAKLSGAEQATAMAEEATAEAVAGAEQAVAAQGVAEGAQAEQAVATEEIRDQLKTANARVTELETQIAEAPKLAELRETAKQIHDADYSALATGAEIRAAAVQGKTGEHKESVAIVIDALWGSFVKGLGDKPAPKQRTGAPAGKRWQIPPTKTPNTNDKAQLTPGQTTIARING